MRTWARQHREAFARALRRLAAQRAATLLNALAIGVALALPAGGYALLSGLKAVAQRTSFEPQVSVFLKPGAVRAELEPRLRADERIAAWRFVSRDQALAELRGTEGLSDVIAALERNPLPDSFVLTARQRGAGELDALAASLRGLPGVAHVQVDSAWAARLAAIAYTARLALAALAIVLGAGLVAITFNTIRLQILTQREEIEVSQLLGATDAFVRRPFFYLGALQGLAGGLVALAILAAGLAVLNQGVREIAQAYGSSFRLAFLAPAESVLVVGTSAVLGWLGSLISVSRHLR